MGELRGEGKELGSTYTFLSQLFSSLRYENCNYHSHICKYTEKLSCLIHRQTRSRARLMLFLSFLPSLSPQLFQSSPPIPFQTLLVLETFSSQQLSSYFLLLFPPSMTFHFNATTQTKNFLPFLPF